MKRSPMKRRTKAMKRSGALARTRLTRRRKPDVEARDRAVVKRRSGGRCEVWLPIDNHRLPIHGRCPRQAAEIHHIVKRSQGGVGRGAKNLVHLCHFHHALCDASTAQRSQALDGEVRIGRLRITPGTFQCVMETTKSGGA